MQVLEDQVDPGDAAPGRRVHEPTPHDTGGDEGDRHGKQEDTAENSLPLQSLVKQDRQPQPYHQTANEEANRENGCVPHIDPEARIVQDQVAVLLQPDEGEVGPQALPLAQRNADRPADEPVDEDRHSHHGRQQQCDREICLIAEHVDDDQDPGVQDQAGKQQPDRSQVPFTDVKPGRPQNRKRYCAHDHQDNGDQQFGNAEFKAPCHLASSPRTTTRKIRLQS